MNYLCVHLLLCLCFQATETAFRMAVSRGIINPINNGEVRHSHTHTHTHTHTLTHARTHAQRTHARTELDIDRYRQVDRHTVRQI